MIPKTVHHIWIQGDLKFGLVHYLCMRSAKQVLSPVRMLLHTVGCGYGEWWDRMIRDISPEIVPAESAQKIGDCPRTPPLPIQSGPIRLRALLRYGGIYLDTDVICLKLLDQFLEHKAVLGMEQTNGEVRGLCNAVIMAEPGTPFIGEYLSRFIREYTGGWSEQCTVLPWTIANEHPDWVSVMPTRMFYPFSYGNEIKNIYEVDANIEGSYTMHLWASGCHFRYLDGLTCEDIRNWKTTFGKAATPFLP